MSNKTIVMAFGAAAVLAAGIIIAGGPMWAAIAFGAVTYWLALPVLAAEDSADDE